MASVGSNSIILRDQPIHQSTNPWNNKFATVSPTCLRKARPGCGEYQLPGVHAVHVKEPGVLVKSPAGQGVQVRAPNVFLCICAKYEITADSSIWSTIVGIHPCFGHLYATCALWTVRQIFFYAFNFPMFFPVLLYLCYSIIHVLQDVSHTCVSSNICSPPQVAGATRSTYGEAACISDPVAHGRTRERTAKCVSNITSKACSTENASKDRTGNSVHHSTLWSSISSCSVYQCSQVQLYSVRFSSSSRTSYESLTSLNFAGSPHLLVWCWRTFF